MYKIRRSNYEEGTGIERDKREPGLTKRYTRDRKWLK